jgi:hypothetical protein
MPSPTSRTTPASAAPCRIRNTIRGSTTVGSGHADRLSFTVTHNGQTIDVRDIQALDDLRRSIAGALEAARRGITLHAFEVQVGERR